MAKIGIDFGTTYSTVAYKNPQTGLAEAIRINGSEKIPTMLYYSPEGGEPMIGQEAYEIYNLCNDVDNREEVEQHLSGIFSDLKRNMNKDERLYLPDGRCLTNVQLIAEFFAFIKKEVESTTFHNERVTDLCITHPVNCPIYKKEILVEAAKNAGFDNVKLLMEPIAASMGFSNTTIRSNQSILIYDFGGGTFDLAFVKYNMNEDQVVLPPMGDPNCGGENIDRLLYDVWNKMVLNETGASISGNANDIDVPFLKTTCKQEKEFLSNYFKIMSNWTLKACIRGKFYTMQMTKDAWNNMLTPIIDKTISITQQMLQVIQQEHFELNEVILIGGSSQIPLVSQRLSEILPVAPSKVADSDIAVAKGAALFVNEDDIPVHECFCRGCGKKIDTKKRECPFCGKDNYLYNYKFENEDFTYSEAQTAKTNAAQTEVQTCFCYRCGKEINTSMASCDKCGAKNVNYKV